MSIRISTLSAAISFYERQPSDEETAQIKEQLLIHKAGFDQRVDDSFVLLHLDFDLYNFSKTNQLSKIE